MLFIISCSLDHVVMGIVVTLLLLIAKHDIHINATSSLTSVSYLSYMNPLLYLLSLICAHPCYFPTHQDGQMNMIGMRIIVMNIRLDVNQSMFM
jgi:hypothetical protein